MANTRRTHSQQSRPGDRWLTIAGYIGLGLGCVMLLIATFVVLVAPVDMVRDQLVRDVKAHTGRNLVVAGPSSLMLFPRLGVSFGNVSLSPPPGMGGEPTLRVEALEAQLSLLSLLSQQGGVKRVTLSRPIVNLNIDAQGRRSWDFAAAGDLFGWRRPAGPETARACDRAPPARTQRSSRPRSKSCCRPASASPTARCATAISAPARATRLTLELDLVVNGIDAPLELKGSLVWRGESSRSTALTPIGALVKSRRPGSPASCPAPVEATYDGSLELADGMS